MTANHDSEQADDTREEGQGDDWYFDLPKGAWQRQEQKNRQLRALLRKQVKEQPPPPPEAFQAEREPDLGTEAAEPQRELRRDARAPEPARRLRRAPGLALDDDETESAPPLILNRHRSAEPDTDAEVSSLFEPGDEDDHGWTLPGDSDDGDDHRRTLPGDADDGDDHGWTLPGEVEDVSEHAGQARVARNDGGRVVADEAVRYNDTSPPASGVNRDGEGAPASWELHGEFEDADATGDDTSTPTPSLAAEEAAPVHSRDTDADGTNDQTADSRWDQLLAANGGATSIVDAMREWANSGESVTGADDRRALSEATTLDASRQEQPAAPTADMALAPNGADDVLSEPPAWLSDLLDDGSPGGSADATGADTKPAKQGLLGRLLKRTPEKTLPDAVAPDDERGFMSTPVEEEGDWVVEGGSATEWITDTTAGEESRNDANVEEKETEKGLDEKRTAADADPDEDVLAAANSLLRRVRQGAPAQDAVMSNSERPPGEPPDEPRKGGPADTGFHADDRMADPGADDVATDDEVDPWAEFLAARESDARGVMSPDDGGTEDVLPFANGSSGSESGDSAVPVEPFDRAPADLDPVAARMHDDDPDEDDPFAAFRREESADQAGSGRAWSAPDSHESEPVGSYLDTEPHEGEPDADIADKDEGDDPFAAFRRDTPAEPARAEAAWEAGASHDADPVASRIDESTHNPASAGSWHDDADDAGTGVDTTDDFAEALFREEAPAASPRGEDDLSWDAIVDASGVEDDSGEPILPPGIHGRSRMGGDHESRWMNYLGDDEPDTEESDQPEPESHIRATDEHESVTRDEPVWVTDADPDEQDIVLRAFEAHAAAADSIEEAGQDWVENGPEQPAPDLRDLLGDDHETLIGAPSIFAATVASDRHGWAPQRTIEIDDLDEEDEPEAGRLDRDPAQEPPLIAPWEVPFPGAAETFQDPRARQRARPWIRELIEVGMLAILVFLAVRATFQNFRVDGLSMAPTLQNDQFIIVNKLAYSQVNMDRMGDFIPFISAEPGEHRYVFGSPDRGDIIVFSSPRNPAEDLVKRVIGLPNETIEIRNGQVYINDRLLHEPYIEEAWTGDMRKTLIPPGEYFVMGDNRNNSQDSRSTQMGLVPESLIIGKAELSYFPLDRFAFAPNGGGELSDEPVLTLQRIGD